LRRRKKELLTAANAIIWGPDVEAWQGGLKRPFATIFSGDELANPNELPAGYVGTRFHRGFVAGMAISLADWQRHGKLLVRSMPLESARISDREPMALRDNGFGWWRAFDDAEEVYGDTSDLPKELFDLLVCDNERLNWENTQRIRCAYPTVADAHAALSVAALKLARNRRQNTRNL
jgi:hypothetical protein